METEIGKQQRGNHQLGKGEMEVKYNKIGSNYNSTWKADPLLTKKLLEHLKPEKDGLYLDIGCGTGNYSIALNKKGT